MLGALAPWILNEGIHTNTHAFLLECLKFPHQTTQNGCPFRFKACVVHVMYSHFKLYQPMFNVLAKHKCLIIYMQLLRSSRNVLLSLLSTGLVASLFENHLSNRIYAWHTLWQFARFHFLSLLKNIWPDRSLGRPYSYLCLGPPLAGGNSFQQISALKDDDGDVSIAH